MQDLLVHPHDHIAPLKDRIERKRKRDRESGEVGGPKSHFFVTVVLVSAVGLECSLTGKRVFHVFSKSEWAISMNVNAAHTHARTPTAAPQAGGLTHEHSLKFFFINVAEL